MILLMKKRTCGHEWRFFENDPCCRQNSTSVLCDMQPDYQAEVHDHGTIRIALATPAGQENQRLNDRVQLKIEKHKELSISGRNLRMRFSWSKGYSGEWLAASTWGDVQLYRRPLGLIFIVEAKRQEDADKGIQEYIVKDLQLFYVTVFSLSFQERNSFDNKSVKNPLDSFA